MKGSELVDNTPSFIYILEYAPCGIPVRRAVSDAAYPEEDHSRSVCRYGDLGVDEWDNLGCIRHRCSRKDISIDLLYTQFYISIFNKCG